MLRYFAVIFTMFDMAQYYDVYNVSYNLINTTKSSYTLTFSHQIDNFIPFDDNFIPFDDNFISFGDNFTSFDYSEDLGNIMDYYCPPGSNVCYLPAEDNTKYLENIIFWFDRDTSTCFIDLSHLVDLDLNITDNAVLNTSFYVENSTNFTGSSCFEYLFEFPYYTSEKGFTISFFCD